MPLKILNKIDKIVCPIIQNLKHNTENIDCCKCLRMNRSGFQATSNSAAIK